MSDHWGSFDHHDDDHGLPDFADSHDLPDTHEIHTPELDRHDDWDHHEAPAADHETDIADLPEAHEALPVVDDFPPHLEVGDLPEPVDGFPWVDASTLGTPDAYTPTSDPVDPHELAAYAGIEVPDGADPWTVLTTSDDPAVAALARWWTPDEQ
ncbi:hypothetical protein [Actinoplanes sp. NPDC020271]|uniref:hypothetical protein n=1 Tax=Actinoplanes sp. NPDC020271 TaxID=3363896 RepID=UPI00379B1985